MDDAEDIEFFSLSKALRLTEGFDLLSQQLKGFVVEEAWHKRMLDIVSDYQIFIPAQGEDHDAVRVSNGRRADVKFCAGVHESAYESNAQVYLSHNEYLAGKEHNTIFVVFYNRGGAGAFLKAFTFNEAREAGAIKTFPTGKWAKCPRLDGAPDKAPWAIELFLIDPALRNVNLPKIPKRG